MQEENLISTTYPILKIYQIHNKLNTWIILIVSHGVFPKKKNVRKKLLISSYKNIVQNDKSDPLFTPSPTNYNVKDISVKSPAWVISKSKRKPLTFENYTKNCGFYEYKSYIGEGPKYTISQKFNIDGTLDGKRHPKAHVIEETPGPGSYNIKSDFGGPSYTIGLKRVHKSLSQNSINPPVGLYELRKDSSLIVPSFKFDTEQRNNLEINSNNKNFPGPGSYNDSGKLDTKGIKWSFTHSPRFTKIKPRNPKVVRIKVPGPGSYSFKTFIGKEGPKYTFNKVKYNHSDDIDESYKQKTIKYPSPVSYNKKIDYQSDMPKYTIPKFDLSKFKIKITSPGPGHYNPNNDVNSIFKKITNVIMPKAKKDEDEVKNPNYKKLIIPGPGEYDFKNGLFPQGPKYTISRSIKKKIKLKDELGPGEYNITNNHRNKEPSYSIGKGQRDDDLKLVKKNDYPGPGFYHTQEANTSPKYTFPKDKIGGPKKFDVPGPGFYKIPTSFDNVNDMTRNNGAFDPKFKYV